MDLTKSLVDHHADVNARGKDQRNCLPAASRSTNPNLVQYVVSVGVDVNCKYVDDITLLLKCTSTAKGNMDVTKCLIGLGADVNARDKNQRNCLHFASQSTNPDMVEYLVGKGVDVNSKDINDITPLLIATANGNIDVTKSLIGQGADVNARDKDQWSCLHFASQSTNPDLLTYLVSLGVDVNGKDVNDITPLLISTSKGDTLMIKRLIYLGADINARDKKQWNCLHFATQSAITEPVEYLASLGLDVNSKIMDDISPLSISRNLNATKCHIGFGADVSAAKKNQMNSSHFVPKSKNPEMVQYLASLGVDMNYKYKNDNTPLLISTASGNMDMTKCLIGLGADINATDKNQWNCLHAASQSTNPNLVQYLVSLGVNVNYQNKKDCTPLLLSISYKDDDTAPVLIDSMRDIMRRPSTSNDLSEESAYRELVLCAKLGYTLGARLILDARIDISMTLKQSCLHWSCTYGHIDIVRLLLLAEKDVDLSEGSEKFFLRKLPFSRVIDYFNIIPFRLSHIQKSTALESLICTPGIGNVLKIPCQYAEMVHQAVFDFLLLFPNSASGKTGAELKMCGSAAEGAKVGLPSEIDLLYINDKYSHKSRFIKTTHTFSGYIEVSASEDHYLARGSAYFHENFVDQLQQFLKDILDTKFISRVDFGVGVGLIKRVNRKACTSVLLLWHDELNSILVSVDLVPCVQINDWPTDFISQTWLMDHSELRKRGYIIVPKPPNKNSKIAEKFTEKQLAELWRVSFSHLEVEHIRSLDDSIRNVYVAAKCLRNPDVCHIMITEGKGLPKNVDDYISSYMLKSMFLKNIEDFLCHPQSLEEMVCKVYDDLADALHEGFIPTFFMPTVNVLDGLKLDVEKSAKVAGIMKTFVRKFCTGEEPNMIGGDVKIDIDKQGTYDVFNITNHKWSTLSLNMGRPVQRTAPSYFAALGGSWLIRSASWLFSRLALAYRYLLGRLFGMQQ